MPATGVPLHLTTSLMQRIITAIIILAAAFTHKAAAQVVSVGEHLGLIDNTTHRVLVTTPQPDASLPAVFHYDGADYDVCATTLPLVLLEHGELLSDAFRQGRLTLIEPEAKAGEAPFSCPAEMRYRGATALAYDKKNYAVKLLDPTTADDPDGLQPLDASLLGMRTDNSWILDAMASDMARMRNRVSTDFWLDFSARPYYANDEPDMLNGTRGRFVEAFVGDRYWGLYCLTEKIDRKQLKLKKPKDGAPRGLLYKSYRWDNLVTFTDPWPAATDYTWQGWECSYPDNRKGEPFNWEPLIDIIRFFRITPPDFDLQDSLFLKIDVPLWRDYNLFCDLLHADDNVSKNMYVYYRDVTAETSAPFYNGDLRLAPPPGPMCICPWDLDATWGRTYDRLPIDPKENCNVSNGTNIHLWLSVPQRFIRHYYKRWEELRQDAFLPENIWPYFERYFDLFETSGAGDRETERWDGVNGVHLDFKAEADFIRNWIPRRVWYLDGDYEYANDGIASVDSDASLSTDVYTLDGRVVASCASNSSLQALQLPAGVYVYKHRKYIVR